MSNDESDRREHTEPPTDDHTTEHGHDEFGNDEPENAEFRNGEPGQPGRGQHQQPVAGGAAQTSIGDILQEPDTKEWVKTIAGSMAVAGLGLGLLVFLLGAFGGMELTRSGAQLSDQRYKLQLVNSVFQMAPFLGFAIASVAGLVVGFEMDATDRKRLVTAGAAAFVGLVALVMVAEVIASTQTPANAGLSLDYGQALINSVVLGIVAAVMSGGAAYFATNLDA
jgi:hypothetical protein